MSLCVYAIVSRDPRRLPGHGVGGERLVVVECGEVRVVVGEVAGPPPLDEASLRLHDALVREIAAQVDALLPVRFGTVMTDAGTLTGVLEPHAGDIADALALVQGREQMTLRVFVEGRSAGLSPVPSEPAPEEAQAGPGARYLARLLRAHRSARSVPEIGPLRDALAPLVVAERLEAQHHPPLVASVYHLIRRGDAPAYGVVIDRAHRLCQGARVAATGPWPPWAFVPEVLS